MKINAKYRLQITASGAAQYFDPAAIENAKHVDYKSRSIVIDMPIKDFLAMARPISADASKEKSEGIQDLLDKNVKFESIPMLFFSVDSKSAKVTGHEGRHRGMGLLGLGIKSMPVELRGPIRWSEQSAPNRYDYFTIWPETLVSEDGSKRIPFPVAREDAGKGYKPN